MSRREGLLEFAKRQRAQEGELLKSARDTKDDTSFLEFMLRASMCSIAAELALAIHHEAFPEEGE